MVYDHLNGYQMYKKTSSTCDNKIMNKVKKRIQKYPNILTMLKIDH